MEDDAWTDERLEREIEKPAVAYAVDQGWLEIKIMRANKRGWPDRIFIRLGIVIFVEFKRPDVEPSKQQQKRHRELRAAGVKVYVIDNLEMAYVLLR